MREVWYTVTVQGVTDVPDTDAPEDAIHEQMQRALGARGGPTYAPDQITVDEWGERD